MKKKDTIIIFTANMARELMHDNETLLDIKQHKYNPDKTVFVFKMSDGIRDKIRKLNNKSISEEI